MLRSSSDALLGSTHTAYPRKTLVIGALVLVVSLLVLGSIANRALINMDGAIYAELLDRGELSETTLHIGYYLLGSVFVYLCPASTDYSLNLMNCFFGALTLFLVYLVTYTLSGRHSAAVVSSLFAGTSFVLVVNSLYAETYVSHAFFFLLTIQLWLWNRPVLAGASFGFAFLISPTTLLALPLLVLMRPNKHLLVLLGTSSALVLAVILPNLDDYIYGPRGVLYLATYEFWPGRAIRKQGLELLLGPFMYLPFVVGGIVSMAQRRWRSLGVGILTTWFLTFMLVDTTNDVPVHLPTYLLLCVLGGLGFQRVLDQRYSREGLRESVVVALLCFFFISALVVGVVTRDRFGDMDIWVVGTGIKKTLADVQIYIPVIVGISVIAFLCIATSRWLAGRRRSVSVVAVLVFVVSVNGLLLAVEVGRVAARLAEFRDTSLAISQVAEPGYRVVADWNEGVLFEHYVFGDCYTGTWFSRSWLEERWGAQEWREMRASGREIWLLVDDNWLLYDLYDAGYRVEPFLVAYRAFRAAAPPDHALPHTVA
jgi:hypothetical protein